MVVRRVPAGLTLAALLCVLCSPTARADDGVEFFETKIRPALVEHCSGCHSAGAKKTKGGLRLDTAAFAFKGGEHGPAFKPGNSAGSALLQALRGAHEQVPRMPYKKPPLSDARIVLIAGWIDRRNLGRNGRNLRHLGFGGIARNLDDTLMSFGDNLR